MKYNETVHIRNEIIDNHVTYYLIGMRETAGSKTEKVPEFLCIGSKSSKIGWCTEILIRLILAVIFGLSALFIEPFLRYVEGNTRLD